MFKPGGAINEGLASCSGVSSRPLSHHGSNHDPCWDEPGGDEPGGYEPGGYEPGGDTPLGSSPSVSTPTAVITTGMDATMAALAHFFYATVQGQAQAAGTTELPANEPAVTNRRFSNNWATASPRRSSIGKLPLPAWP